MLQRVWKNTGQDYWELKKNSGMEKSIYIEHLNLLCTCWEKYIKSVLNLAKAITVWLFKVPFFLPFSHFSMYSRKLKNCNGSI